MQGLRGVADDDCTRRGDVVGAEAQHQRYGGALFDRPEIADAIAETFMEAIHECRFGQAREFPGVRACHRPDQREPVAEGQQRERPFGREALPCAAARCGSRTQQGDDGRLAVVAQREIVADGLATVGEHDQPRAHRLSAVQRGGGGIGRAMPANDAAGHVYRRDAVPQFRCQRTQIVDITQRGQSEILAAQQGAAEAAGL